MEDKAAIRKRVRAMLEAQAPEERRRKSDEIRRKLFARPEFRSAACVCFYVAMPHEVDTAPMIDEALSVGKRVTVPRCDLETVELTLYEIRHRAHLKPGTWGILEPEAHPERVVHPKDVDCFVVPGVAFDADGNRIGNAKGFYDRFLKKTLPGAAKIGLAYRMQLVPGVPVEPHDVKLDFILTD